VVVRFALSLQGEKAVSETKAEEREREKTHREVGAELVLA